MASEAGGSRPLVIDIEEDYIVSPTVVVDTVSVDDGTRAQESGTQSEGPYADVDEPTP